MVKFTNICLEGKEWKSLFFWPLCKLFDIIYIHKIKVLSNGRTSFKFILKASNMFKIIGSIVRNTN